MQPKSSAIEASAQADLTGRSAAGRLGGLLGLSSALLLCGCTETPVAAPLRALQSSGPVAFVCLDDPALGEVSDFARPLRECSGTRTATTSDYSVPHLYALVLQPLRGEVAVIDLTTSSQPVLDQDPTIPGSSFLPVGAQPTDIVATPGGAAAFVAVAEQSFEAIYALPSGWIRPGSRPIEPTLTEWPSCTLPAAPGAMTIALDPADAEGSIRPSCDPDPEAAETEPARRAVNLDDDAEDCGRPGRYKLIVMLPAEGGFAVIDAQKLLDTVVPEDEEQSLQRSPFEPCEIERWVPLSVDLPPPPEDEPPPPPSDACFEEPPAGGPFASGYQATPAGIAQDGERLYIADQTAPVIHRIDLPSPCEPLELPPLVARSAEDPYRIVTTSRVAVSPKTLDLKQYVYAVDVLDSSLMVFDVSDDATAEGPLERPSPQLNPFQPVDRIRFGAPPRDVIILQHQNDVANDQTGASVPAVCDPDPDSTGPGTLYQTAADYSSGAGPLTLRGVFAFAVLASGDIVTIDIDDYDAPCRGPRAPHPLLGCTGTSDKELKTSDEYTCNAVVPHQLRAGAFLIENEEVAKNQPGVQSLPKLFNPDGSAANPGSEDEADAKAKPRMLATTPGTPTWTTPEGKRVLELELTTGSDLETLSIDGMLREEPLSHTLAFNLEDPRAHTFEQAWSVTYEGGLPGFGGRFASLERHEIGGDRFELRDVGARFCGAGTLSQQAWEAMLASDAEDLADYVQIRSSTPIDTDSYWAAPGTQCTFTHCRNTYGTVEQPIETRDFRIIEATEDTLQLEPRAGVAAPEVKCCFPGVIEYAVRAGNQWVVFGDVAGFLHNVVAAEDGTCRPSCDPNLARLSGRVREAPGDRYPNLCPESVLKQEDKEEEEYGCPEGCIHMDVEENVDGKTWIWCQSSIAEIVDGEGPYAFSNPLFRFAIYKGTTPSVRDMQFRFSSQGSFIPLTMSVITNDADVQPQAIRYLTPTGELVVSDGSLEGITLLDLNTLTVTRQYN